MQAVGRAHVHHVAVPDHRDIQLVRQRVPVDAQQQVAMRLATQAERRVYRPRARRRCISTEPQTSGRRRGRNHEYAISGLRLDSRRRTGSTLRRTRAAKPWGGAARRGRAPRPSCCVVRCVGSFPRGEVNLGTTTAFYPADMFLAGTRTATASETGARSRAQGRTRRSWADTPSDVTARGAGAGGDTRGTRGLRGARSPSRDSKSQRQMSAAPGEKDDDLLTRPLPREMPPSFAARHRRARGPRAGAVPHGAVPSAKTPRAPRSCASARVHRAESRARPLGRHRPRRGPRRARRAVPHRAVVGPGPSGPGRAIAARGDGDPAGRVHGGRGDHSGYLATWRREAGVEVPADLPGLYERQRELEDIRKDKEGTRRGCARRLRSSREQRIRRLDNRRRRIFRTVRHRAHPRPGADDGAPSSPTRPPHPDGASADPDTPRLTRQAGSCRVDRVAQSFARARSVQGTVSGGSKKKWYEPDSDDDSVKSFHRPVSPFVFPSSPRR